MSFPRYDSYQDSGVKWLGEVPSHWRAVPFWALFQRVKRVGFLDEELLSVYRDYGVIRKSDRDDNFNNPSEDLSTYQLVQPGDLAINKMKAWQGSLGISPFRGIVSPAYFVYRALHQERSAYLHYLLRSPPFAAGFMTISKGIRPNQWDVDPDHLSQIAIPLPSVAEQAAIAAFLDRETAKIDALVEEQRRLIELLKEKRQAVISHAVTKGLDPSAPMKDSGVEWLGEAPAHWDVMALKHLTDEITVGIVVEPSKYYVDEGVPALRSLNVRPGSIRLEELVYISAEANDLHSKSKLRKGDLIAVRTGQPGTAAVVPPELDGCNCVDLIIIRPTADCDERFLCWYLASDAARYQFSEGSGGAIQQHFNVGEARELKVTLPPMAEQQAIAAYLERETAKLDELSGQCERAVQLLAEHRAALISAAVTGKIDVRGWSATDVRKAVSAEIIHFHARERTFGRVKNQKLLYLAEAHAGIHEIGGRYMREAAGPYDADLMGAVERELQNDGVLTVSQSDGRGSAVSYVLSRGWKPDRERLKAMLGDRMAALDHLNAKLADLDTREAEAVATLYAVWNDALLNGESCDDARLIRGFLDEWHPEKRQKFKADDVRNWRGWLQRNGLVPKGQGPKTAMGRLL